MARKLIKQPESKRGHDFIYRIDPDKAFLFKSGESENWLPKSQVKIYKGKDTCKVEIPAWLYNKMNKIENL